MCYWRHRGAQHNAQTSIRKHNLLHHDLSANAEFRAQLSQSDWLQTQFKFKPRYKFIFKTAKSDGRNFQKQICAREKKQKTKPKTKPPIYLFILPNSSNNITQDNEELRTDSNMFEPHHQQEFGVEIAERDPVTGAVITTRCLFCAHLGRDPAPENALRQRRRSVHVWKNLSPMSYRRHHEGQHATLWGRYQASTPAEKNAFFGAGRVHDESSNAAQRPTNGNSLLTRVVATALAAVSPASPAVEGGNKRPVGRPRADGSIPMQWTDRMAQRLVELRCVRCYGCYDSGHPVF